MAARASVTWTHFSVLSEVTWGKTRCVRADLGVRADASPSPPRPSPPLPSPPLPPLPPYLPSAVRADAKKIKIKIKKNKNKNKNKKFTIFLVETNKQISIFNFRFSIPKLPKLPELRGLRRRNREKKKVFSA
jgi:hypothetical protein